MWVLIIFYYDSYGVTHMKTIHIMLPTKNNDVWFTDIFKKLRQ